MNGSSLRSSGPRGVAARVTVAGALAGLLASAGAGAVTAGPAVADDVVRLSDTSPPQVESIRFSRTSVAVSGLALVPVRVSVRLTDASGVRETGPDMSPSPQLTLGSVPGFRSQLRPALARTSGTATDGVWSATLHVPSTWNGTVRVTSVDAVDTAGNRLSRKLTGARSPALRVKGTHRPALSFSYTPLPAGGFHIHGRAHFADTGRPIARQALATAYDSNCDLEGGAVNTIKTDSRGRYDKRWPNGGAGAAGCVALIGRAAPGQHSTVIAYRSASAPRASIPDAALLQAADLHGVSPNPVTDDYWSALRPPQPCGARYPSAALRRADRAITALIGINDHPTVVMEHVATYRSNGAHRYLRELRRAVTGCRVGNPHDARWTVLRTGVAGDESVLLSLREYVDYAEMYKYTYVLVARVGPALVVVADTGWETASGHKALVRELGAAAVRRAAVLKH